MFIEDALKKILSDSADVSSLIATRVFPGVVEQTTVFPAVAYRRVDEEREPTIDTPATAPPRARFVFFSVVKAGTYNGMTARRFASSVDSAVRNALLGFSGDVIVDALSPPEVLNIQGIFFVRSADTYDDKTQTYQFGTVYDVHFTEPN